MTDPVTHWDNVYRTKRFDAVSWYAPHLGESLRLIGELAPGPDAAVIDVGGGESTLVDDLLDRGYRDLTVLDISATAIDFTRRRLGARAEVVRWMVGDVTQADFAGRRFDFWHDRAVFHFLTDAGRRAAYVERLKATVRPGGHAVIATFGPEGPVKCSGLDVVRYDEHALVAALGEGVSLVGSRIGEHATPAGGRQQFLYCWCRVG